MKKIRKILLIFTSFAFIILNSSFVKAEIPPQIFEAVKTSNSSLLSSYLYSSVEMLVLDKDDIYSKQQATIILKDFFTKNKVKTFSIMHQGGKDKAQYAICKIQTEKNINYRIYFLVKQENDKFLIHQLRIEE